MYQKIVFALLLGLMVAGCGAENGGGGGGDTNGTTNTDSNNSGVDINLTQAIADGNVTGYDASKNGTPQVQQNYLVILNYLRSLSITCNDDAAITGPSSPEMVWNDHLADAAEEHSEDMRKSVWYNHDGSGTVNDKTAQDLGLGRGSYFDERIEHNGFAGSLKAENIATSGANYVLPSDYWLKVMEGWMASTHGHCSNIMNPALTQFGMYESRAAQDGSGTYKIYWTQDFGGN